MAINIKYLEKKGLEPLDLLILEILHQNSTEDMTGELVLYLDEKHMERFLALDLIGYVKAKKKDEHDFRRLRLSKKGKDIYRNARILDYTEFDENLFAAVEKIYNSLEKPVGNDIRVKQLLAWFRAETGYSRKQIFKAIRVFIEIEQEKSGGKYIPSAENLIWKGSNLFATKWTLADSRLYQFIQENKKHLNANT